MKLVMSERVKYRVTGLVVIMSVAAIFVPTLMKNSNHRFEENISLAVHLPAKPTPPKVLIANENTLFQSVKVAHADIPKVVEELRATQIAKAETLNTRSVVPAAPVASKPLIAKAELAIVPAAKIAASTPPKILAKVVEPKAIKLNDVKKEVYAVQLASFSQQDNAKSLVNRLRSKGYIASYNKFSGKQGEFYKVLVGQLHEKDKAQHLQKQLADSLQLLGFVVKTGVS
jgi:DedD protein